MALVKNRGPARAIADVSWTHFLQITIDPWFPSSKTCSACGLLLDTLPLGVRTWTCACGVTHGRDLNAARNILAAGLAVTACGDGARPTRH